MSFNYDVEAPTDITRIRYQVGDTDEATAIYSDEEISFVLDEEESSVGKAVISLIQSVITRLAHEPDMTADWLRVDWRRSSDNWFKLLEEKRRKYGIGLTVRARAGHVWRPDVQDEAPDYND
jgi:hypothetical protein